MHGKALQQLQQSRQTALEGKLAQACAEYLQHPSDEKKMVEFSTCLDDVQCAKLIPDTAPTQQVLDLRRTLLKALQLLKTHGVAKLLGESDMESVFKRLQKAYEVLQEADVDEVKVIIAFASLASAVKKIQAFPSIAAFTSIDKDDALARKLLEGYHTCSPNLTSSAASRAIQGCKHVTDAAWSLLEKVVAHLQEGVDEKVMADVEKLEQRMGGMLDGSMWNAGLSETSSWEEVCALAKTNLLKKEKGNELQALVKQVGQVF